MHVCPESRIYILSIVWFSCPQQRSFYISLLFDLLLFDKIKLGYCMMSSFITSCIWPSAVLWTFYILATVKPVIRGHSPTLVDKIVLQSLAHLRFTYFVIDTSDYRGEAGLLKAFQSLHLQVSMQYNGYGCGFIISKLQVQIPQEF